MGNIRPKLGGLFVSLAAVCRVVSELPLSWWPAPSPGDSYVFNPPLFSAIWAERILYPAVGSLAGVLLLIGLSTLFQRDSAEMASWQRSCAIGSLAGIGCIVVSVVTVQLLPAKAVVTGALGALLGLLAAVIATVGLVGWGVGYVLFERYRLGGALAAIPLFEVLKLLRSLLGLDFEYAGGLFTAVIAFVLFTIGYVQWAGNALSSQKPS
jgi:hypothetical protein